MRILVTRPVDEAQRTASTLQALGFDTLIAPMLVIETVSDAEFGNGPWSALLMTSGNAARAIAQHPMLSTLIGLQVFAVGRQTAQAARHVGFSNVVSAEGDGEDLARVAVSHLQNRSKPLLYLAGSDRARDLPGDLSGDGLAVETVVVYRASGASSFSNDVADALRAGAIDGVLHFSRRSAAAFVDCMTAADLSGNIRSLSHFCLSERASEPLRRAGANAVTVARHPEEAALIDLLPRS